MLPIDPMTSLAMSVQTNPGGYALLLGSGVSSAASIPTGRQITLDLIERLAAAENENTNGDPSDWFHKKFKRDPDYSFLLEHVYDQASRQAALRVHFEPGSAEDKQAGKKMPTKAHRAIARLVRDGYIRVVITTNFDRLLEIALSDEGIEPDVVSTSDDIKGAPSPLLSKCFLLKVNGDYHDTRIKNTEKELARYDHRMNRLLNHIFDSCGLIVCGWSVDYDKALRDSI